MWQFFIQFFKLNYSIFLIIKCALSSDSTLWEINNPIYYFFFFFEPEKSYPKNSMVYCIFALFCDHLSKSLKILRWIVLLLHFLGTLLIFYNILGSGHNHDAFLVRLGQLFPSSTGRKSFLDFRGIVSQTFLKELGKWFP